jgi:RNA polymerase sigma factor (sigma-70 family)
LAEDFPNESRAAFEEFYRRHTGYVFARTKQWIEESELRSRLLDQEQLVLSTMERAYRKAASFRDQSGGDLKLATNQVRAWLFRIATNLAHSAMRSPAMQMRIQEMPIADPMEDLEEVDPVNVNPQLAARVDAALDSLNEVDRDILLTCLSYGALGERAAPLPVDVRKELLEKYGLSEATLRQRKSRALKRLQDFLS